MRYIVEWIFWVVLAVLVSFLGNSRREEKRVDPNKTVMRHIPMLRFGMYFIGIILIALFGFIGTRAIGDGAHKEEPWLVPVILLGVLAGLLSFMAGYIFYARHVFFDEEELIVGRPFRRSLYLGWQEIGRMERKKNQIWLYKADGKKLLKADPSLENYDLFADMAKRMCSAKQTQRASQEWKNGERIMARRAAERIIYGIAILLVISLVIMGNLGDYNLSEMFTRADMTIFRVTLVLAVAIFFYGIWLHLDRIRYTEKEITFYVLFFKKTFSWRELKKIRKARVGQMEVEKLFLTFDGKEYAVNSAKYQEEYESLLDFVIDLALRQGIPTENL